MKDSPPSRLGRLVSDIETRVRTALSALRTERIHRAWQQHSARLCHRYHRQEHGRGKTAPHRITLFSEDEMKNAIRIIKSLITQKHIAKAQDSEAESASITSPTSSGLSKRDVISPLTECDRKASLPIPVTCQPICKTSATSNASLSRMLENFAKLERYILEHIPDESLHITYKQLNDNAVHDGIKTSTEKQIRTPLYFLAVKGYTHKKEDGVSQSRRNERQRYRDHHQAIRKKNCRFAHSLSKRLYSLAEGKQFKRETSPILGSRTSERSEIQQPIAFLRLLFPAVGRRGGSLALPLQDRSHEAGRRIPGILQCDGN